MFILFIELRECLAANLKLEYNIVLRICIKRLSSDHIYNLILNVNYSYQIWREFDANIWRENYLAAKSCCEYFLAQCFFPQFSYISPNTSSIIPHNTSACDSLKAKLGRSRIAASPHPPILTPLARHANKNLAL